jgi:vacuolar-type H+-ATPase subunit H
MAQPRHASQSSDQRSRSAEQDRDQQSSQENQQSQGRSAPVNLTANALRTMGQFFDMQTAMMRTLLRAQMRAGASLGFRDYSPLLQVADERTLSLFSAMTDHVTQFNRQADDILNEIHSHLGRVIEKQMIDLTERTQYGLEEFKNQATESMEEIRELSRQQAEEMTRTNESLTDAARNTVREGGEQFRAIIQQGREVISRQAETIREESERAAAAGQEAMQEGGKAMQEGARASAEKQEGGKAAAESVERNSRTSRS